jgi:hypothetical protein
MRRHVLVAILGVFALAIAMACVDIDRFVDAGPAAPEDYAILKWKTEDERPNCGVNRPPEVSASLKKDLRLYMPSWGSDLMIIRNPLDLMIFDSASPQELTEHDTLVLPDTPRSTFTFKRIGPHLLICAPARFLSIAIARQYCHGGQGDTAWNNEIEEITFPQSRETWLDDKIYDSMPRDGSFPSVDRLRDFYQMGDFAQEAKKEWHVKPFRDVLPGAWLSSIECRRDLP